MELPKEWEDAALEAADMDMSSNESPRQFAKLIAIRTANRLAALQDKPVRELTDAEIDAIGEPYGYFKFNDAQGGVRYAFARAVIAAHQRKQREPETVRVDVYFYRLENGDVIASSVGPAPIKQ